MKTLITLLLISLISSIAYGQITVKGAAANQYAKFEPLTHLDQATLECIYEYTVKDPRLQETEIYYDILQVGKRVSKYAAYPDYLIDSVMCRMEDITKVTFGQFTAISNQYEGWKASKYTIVKDHRTKTLSYYDRVFTDRYVYPDTIAIGWQLSDETKTVCGYTCRKATATFRGRGWTAWYATDIPVNDGPWKFGGLPGLILQIEDATGDQHFTAISIRTPTENISIRKRSEPFKTTRKRFNKQLNDYRSDPGKIMSGSPFAGKTVDGKEIPVPKRQLFHNPIELE
ncbi:GLPGLI family protein [Tannerella sp.]|uniref:GLPGLI family protein n=1 Tax=Tannerella sp. TaxID=2382127 RepID=UPI0026DACE7A|nr:GLPGLI family protein [Tannerella sp.]MDO4704466.1 GLPGLI family protein [Tannerella sp.]